MRFLQFFMHADVVDSTPGGYIRHGRSWPAMRPLAVRQVEYVLATTIITVKRG
jgi:hypothetical protein